MILFAKHRWSYVILLACFTLVVQAQLVIEDTQIKEEMEALVAKLDGGQLGRSLTNKDFALSLFQQVLERNPTQQEWATAEALLLGQRCCDREQAHIIVVRRSQLLALLLAKKAGTHVLHYDTLRRYLPLLRGLNFESIAPWQQPVIKQAKKTSPINDLGVQAHTGDYQLYYGYLHAHTSFSDGQGLPEEAYTMARDQAKLDFFAVTDHAELLLIWPWDNKWERLKQTARSFHKSGEFVALHGFEWSSPLFGHVNIIHSEEMTNCIEDLFIEDICDWIAEHPRAISRFNHPGYSVFQDWEFDHFKLYPAAVRQMVGIETHNGGEGLGHYLSQKAYGTQYNHFDLANQKGWKIGALGGQDNHSKDWGLKNDFLVGVWAESLTRRGILTAYRQRRIFATEDRTIGLSFKMDAAEMGSRLLAGEKTIDISLWDQERENFVRIDVYKAGVVLHSYETKSSAPKFSLKVDTAPGDYFYVVATQEDGDLALSSPIWVVE